MDNPLAETWLCSWRLPAKTATVHKEVVAHKPWVCMKEEAVKEARAWPILHGSTLEMGALSSTLVSTSPGILRLMT